jgi:hypothetical protein
MSVSWMLREAKFSDDTVDPAASRRGLNLEVGDV